MRRPARRERLRRWLRLPTLGVVGFLLQGANGLEPETLLRDFEIIAFGAELGQETDGRLHKWQRPIRVFLDIRAGEAELYRRLTENHLERLAGLTGLEISLADELSQANLVIVFDRDAQLVSSMARHAPGLTTAAIALDKAFCFAQFWHGQDSGEIKRAVIGIPSDRAASEGKLPHCIVEETTQVLGLPNDSDDVNPSIFNDRSVFDDLTLHDQALLRLLYDPRLRAGMPRDEALAVARWILRQEPF